MILFTEPQLLVGQDETLPTNLNFFKEMQLLAHTLQITELKTNKKLLQIW